MLDSGKIKALIEEALGALPPGAKQLPEEIKQQVRISFNRVLADLDVVTREEFDIQVKVLAKTRAKLEALEKQLQS